ncbi:hypothetical protein F4777DRAFT_537430 [Nemania sp. FL0916]|nr:hypothetical protein F4777DRAFT_537430 [Nemania sp. FL0916]
MATTIPNTELHSRNEQRQSLLLSMLPVEMILDIADQTTTAADAVSLALTCKALFSILSGNSLKRLNADSKEMLLITLERDISWVVYCPVAGKLLPFYSRGRGFYYPKTPYINQSFGVGGPLSTYLMCPDKSPLISFLETRLVRNHRLFGYGHGIPPSCLSLTGTRFSNCQFTSTQYRIFLDISRTAKWIGENLLLSSTWIVHVTGLEMAGRDISTKSLRNILKTLFLDYACYHCAIHGKENDSYGVLHPRFHEAGAKLSENSSYEGTGACSVCETDWDVSISWSGSGRSLVFKLIKYHDLGCCSIPPDPKWLRLLRHSTYRDLRDPPRDTCHGSVRHRWIHDG